VPQAREYWETLPCPPPATVYGMLLSAVGEPNRIHHEGAEVALALLSAPELSVVVRTLWRMKDQKLAPRYWRESPPRLSRAFEQCSARSVGAQRRGNRAAVPF